MADRVDVADLAVNFVSSGETGVTGGLQSISSHLLGIAGPAGEAAAAVVAAGIGIAGASVVMAADFQESMTQLVTGAGESKANLQLVSDGILGIARDTGTSTSQLAQGMYMVESAGYHGAAGLDVLRAAAEGAKVGNADLGTVADATTTLLTDFGSQGINASQAVNVLIGTVASGKTHMQDLAQALSQVAPVASTAKVHLADMMAAMATMTAEGVPAADAATYLRQTLIALDAPTKQTKDALASVGLKASDVSAELQQSLPGALQMITDAVGKKFPAGSAQYVNALKDIAGGSKQMQGILDLTGSHMSTLAGDAQHLAGTIADGKGAISGWDETQGDFNEVLARGREQVETMMISLGEKLLPVLTKVADYVVTNVLPAVGGFLGFLETHQAIIGTVALVLGGALVGALIAATVAAWGLAAGVVAATWPFLAIGAAVGLLAAGLIYAYQHIGPFRDAVNSVVSAVKEDIAWVQKLMGVVRLLGNVFADVGTLIDDVMHFRITKVKDDVTRIQRDWNNDMRTLADQMVTDQKNAADKAALDAEQAALKKKQGVLAQAADEADKQAKIAQQEYDYDTKMANASKDAATKAYYQKAADVAKAQMTEQQQVAASARQEAGQVSQQMTALKQNATASARDTASQVLAHLTSMSGGGIEQSRRLRQSVTADLSSMQQDGVADAVKLAQGVSGQMQTMASQTGAWGKDAAVNFANGLLAGQGNVDGAVNQLVLRVAAKMQHSKPSEGPLRDDDVWGLHLAENFAAGLVRGAAVVADAAGSVARAATGVVPGGGLGTLSAGAYGPLPGVGAAPAGGTGQTVVVLSLDGRHLSEAVVPHLPRTFAIGTGARSW